MSTTRAAVVTSFDEPPRYGTFEIPDVPDSDHQIGDVLAVGLHPRVRSGASGSHYTSDGILPLVPGIDGVARLANGDKVFFVADDDLPGPMAEKTVVDMRRAVVLPEGADIPAIAAAMNPAMSSWVALRRRVAITPGQTVLVLGATGNAGAMAIQVARRLGAGHVIAAGRNRSRLDELADLGADTLVPLVDDETAAEDALSSACSDVDIVIDYLWGRPAQRAMRALVVGRNDRSKALDWIQIGSIAGTAIELPSELLRASNLRIFGNGQGAVSTQGYLAELPSLIDEIDAGTFRIATRIVALSDIETAWSKGESGSTRTVVVP
ncbi:quinone oxidoreductase family protein [Antrihabitans cavernicola]|uniref:Zinc-binding dehydrogenase n=1 Tax=Antrihabitans cavernicola TaxID=2495913 RepID=A0A5A7S7C9_9NOCA|nr:zinc-binding dehydrogenase [Spelaeibacter cavernicola]KAA0021404.1 zinc-binding dehydrogenase [Spelaeibacter cavernicola]